MLVLDGSVIKRNRSNKVELLAKVYDHVEHKFQKGFTLLTLGWSDGYSFIPVLRRAMFCDDIQDMDLTTALQSLMAQFVEQLNNLPAEITNIIKSKVDDWMKSQASFIQALFGNLSWES